MKDLLRPQGDGRKIHSKDEFELCYLRHKYLRRANRNPSQEEMAPYQKTIRMCAHRTFSTYQSLFIAVGFDVDDLISVGRVQLVSFLCLFSVESNQGVEDRFFSAFVRKNAKIPKSKDVLDRNQANFTHFIKQRFEDVVRVCRQKARNIKGCGVDEYEFFYGVKKPSKNIRDLLIDYASLGFKKTDLPTYRAARKKAGEKGSVFKHNRLWWVCIPVETKPLAAEDLFGADLNPYDSFHNMTPEQIVLERENIVQYEEKVEKFQQMLPEERATILRDFISMNKANGSMTKEIETANKTLRLLEKECEQRKTAD
jgi:hypothetical protein